MGCEPGAESALTAVIPRVYDRTRLVSDSNGRPERTEPVRFRLVPVRSTSVRSVSVRTVLEHPPQGGVPFPNTRGRGGYPPQIDLGPLSDVPSKTF